MLELIYLLLAGIFTGMLIGLFPVFPIYLSAFLLYFTSTFLTPEQMLLFWAISSLGSQFFCSVSSITLGIPGDTSSLVYMDHIRNFNLDERNKLLWTTARGSIIGALFAYGVVWSLYTVYNSFGFRFLGGVDVKLAMLYTILFFFIIASDKKIASAIVGAIALFISPQNNYNLPDYWYYASIWLQDTTFFMIVLGTFVIPEIFFYKSEYIDKHPVKYNVKPEPLPLKVVGANTILGTLVGLIPGPTSELAAALGYQLTRGTAKIKIIAAETANNPAIVMMILPFFMLGLPITPSSIIVSNIMDINIVNVVDLGKEASQVISGVTVFDAMVILGAVTAVIYYFLSIRFINAYTMIVELAHTKLKYWLVAVVALMVYFDLSIQEMDPWTYGYLLTGYIAFGFLLRYFKISPIPFVFVFLLGDTIIWTTMQWYILNF